MSFTIYPAIDLKDSNAVRLKQGDMNQSQVFSLDPAETAKEFEMAGARITSYNVCYTKLLRLKATSTHILSTPITL